MAQPEPALGTRIGACRRSEQVCHHDRMEAMETQQESRGRLARPLIRLVCAYVWRRHALARTATTSRSTTAPGMRARPSKRRCRKPSRARVAGRCPRQPLSGNPVCQCYIGEWRGVHRAHLAGTGQWCFGPPVRRRVLCGVAGDHPGRHADGVPRAPRLCERNAYRMASQSVRCCRTRSAVSCGLGSAAVIPSAPKSPGEPAISTTHVRCFRTYADFPLVNPLRAAKPVLSLTLSPYSPDSCQFADHMCIRPENIGGILFTGRHAR